MKLLNSPVPSEWQKDLRIIWNGSTHTFTNEQTFLRSIAKPSNI